MRVMPMNLVTLRQASRTLCQFASNVTSQSGEDGIIAKALSVLPKRDRWCVEFGAWDGKQYSNTYDLVDRQGYSVVLIEGDRSRYNQLCATYPHPDRAIYINCYVGWLPSDGLDQILATHPIPKDFDLLSIDVDGNDYHIWSGVKLYRPKFVLIEYNPTIANTVQFVQEPNRNCNQGCSPAALCLLGKEKGYELVAATRLNLLFVDERYYSLFSIPDNSLELIRDEKIGHVFFGYDGTAHIDGDLGASWHGIKISPTKLQVLPRWLRCYPPTYSFWQRLGFQFYRIVTKAPTRAGIAKVREYVERSWGGARL
jgi:hypothetical protein